MARSLPRGSDMRAFVRESLSLTGPGGSRSIPRGGFGGAVIIVSTASTCEITSGTPISQPPVMCKRMGFTRSGQIGYTSVMDEPLLFGKVKIWGQVIEHEAGYRSEFGKIVSLDYGHPELLDKFRRIYRVNHGGPVAR